MAKISMIERQKKRVALVAKYAARREALKAAGEGREPARREERFKAALKLAKLPRNSSATRLHSRCEVTGRPRSYYRKLRMSRIALRDLASKGQIPGMVKSSW